MQRVARNVHVDTAAWTRRFAVDVAWFARHTKLPQRTAPALATVLVIALGTTAAFAVTAHSPGVPTAAAPPTDVAWLDGTAAPLAWCGPINVEHSRSEPDTGQTDVVVTTLARVGAALGREVVFNDTTRAPDLRVRWVDSSDDLPTPAADRVVGQGRRILRNDRVVSGEIWLVRSLDDAAIAGVLFHEVGHALVGLDHSSSPDDAMHSPVVSSRPPGFSAREQVAARWAGTSACTSPSSATTTKEIHRP